MDAVTGYPAVALRPGVGEVSFGILGAGMVADYHRRAIAANAGEGARLASVGYHDRARAGELSARFEAPCVSEAELLDDPGIDVVCICTPSGLHAEQVIRCARSGKHVLVEKPMALDLQDADEMIDVCERADVRLGVVLQRRAEPLFVRLSEAISAGDLGRPTLGVIALPYHRPQSYFEQAAWRGTWALDGGGVLMNQGIHLVDLLIWYMGDPVEVTGQARTLAHRLEVEDTLSATLELSSGGLATVSATTTAAPGAPHRVEIYGTGGYVQIEGESVRRWRLQDPDRAVVPPLPEESVDDTGAAGDPRGIDLGGHSSILRDMMEAVRAGRRPMVDGREGRRSLAAVLSIYEAAGWLPA
ncbi:MAG: Gfo/Idh/MocA family protein [Actinomycetota bacterium]